MNLAIEYCGTFWHHEGHRDRLYHQKKYQQCVKKGIRLLTIFDNEWDDKKDILIRKIQHIIGNLDSRIMARKCQIEKIKEKTADALYDKFHIQGATKCPINYGLFFEDELVAAM